MLPNWPGAAGAYSRAYRILANMCTAEARAVKRGRYSPSPEIREYIDALDKGDEHDIKAYNLRFLAYDR